MGKRTFVDVVIVFSGRRWLVVFSCLPFFIFVFSCGRSSLVLSVPFFDKRDRARIVQPMTCCSCSVKGWLMNAVLR